MVNSESREPILAHLVAWLSPHCLALGENEHLCGVNADRGHQQSGYVGSFVRVFGFKDQKSANLWRFCRELLESLPLPFFHAHDQEGCILAPNPS
jgi:hypothetical protein